MKKNETAYCSIHGSFYSGFPKCPFCKELKDALKDDCSWCSYRIIEKECPNCGRKP
jgi:hypothetical protein